MTMGHLADEPSATPVPGLRVERAEGSPLHHTQAGRIAVPLALMRGAQLIERLALVLTAEQMESFYEEIGEILYRRRSTESAPAAGAAS
ncbi:hypothetical protein ACFWBR_27260 [Streptomyces sp. NPDC060006]|uniref:hypothetical protein n=1 Tax=unclassified Streptomyces TaxID=2593676 RepID=UPI00368C9739